MGILNVGGKNENSQVFTLEEFVKKYLPDSELIIVSKKDIKSVKFHIRMLHGGGYHDVDKFYKE